MGSALDAGAWRRRRPNANSAFRATGTKTNMEPVRPPLLWSSYSLVIASCDESVTSGDQLQVVYRNFRQQKHFILSLADLFEPNIRVSLQNQSNFEPGRICLSVAAS